MVDPPSPPYLPCRWAMDADILTSALHCRHFSEGGPSLTSLSTLRDGHECWHPDLGPHCRQFSECGPSLISLYTLRAGHECYTSTPARTADSSVKVDPPSPPYLPCRHWVVTHRPQLCTANSSVKVVGLPSPPCLPCGWAMGGNTPTSALHCR